MKAPEQWYTEMKTMTNIQQLDKQYIAHTYNRFPITLTHGSGSLVYDETGKEYIDMGTGIAVNAFGIADPVWQHAVINQLGKLQHSSNLYYTEPCALLARELCERTGMKKVFFANSGAEANECAIKTARKYAAEKKGPEYSTIITLINSFHGRTLTTLAATGQEHYHELFRPLTPGFVHADPTDINDVRRLLDTYPTAGILFECVQGEGGVTALDEAYVRGLAELAAEYDVLLMTDEVQTGNGRTGALYAYMNYGITPDVITTAKGLGGGLPLGACIIGEKAEEVFGFGDHGSTFGGNPVCCAGALSVIDRMDEAFLAGVRQRSEYLFGSFSCAAGIEAVTGMGLMLGLKTTRPNAEIVAECMEQGVLCLTAKDRVRLLPALNIPMELMAKAAETILRVCAAG